MAGHSKWANIKHKKDRADKAKAKAFSRVAKEIISAVRVGGPDPKANSRLRLAVQKARAVNFPTDSIERNIKKGASTDQSNYTEMSYELYGYGGVGLIVDVMTDNKNRIASEIRIATNKRGGTIAVPGAVSFNFERKGVLEVAKEGLEEDDLFLLVSDAGAEDFSSEEENYMVITPSEALYQVKEAIDEAGGKTLSAELQMVPKTLVEVDAETAKANQGLIDWLEDIDDVDVVYHNMDE